LAAVGALEGLLQLQLPGNSFVAEQQQRQLAQQLVEDCSAAGAAAAAAAEGEEPSTAAPAVGSIEALSSSSSSCSSRSNCGGSSSSSTPVKRHVSQATVQQTEQQLPSNSSTRQLSTWLSQLQQLQVLDFSECRLQQGLLDQLPQLTALTRLQLRRACLDVPHLAAAGAAETAVQLQRLIVGEEFEQQQRERYSQHVLALGADAAVSCAVIGRMQQLVELDVSHIANACEQLCIGAQAVPGLQHLRSINISHTACTEQQLQQLMACCPSLRTLNAGGNEDLNSVGGCYI
jgi:hypothetical protein